MLQALRGVITPAGDKMSEPLKKQIHASLVQMIGYSEDTTRYAAAGCLGALSRWLNPEQLETTLNDYMLCMFYSIIIYTPIVVIIILIENKVMIHQLTGLYDMAVQQQFLYH